MLRAEREATWVQIVALEQSFEAIVEASAITVLDDEHDPDGSTIGFERAQIAFLLRQARGHLNDLDVARERLRDGVYGVCARCTHRIALERLLAHPSAQTCIECATTTGGST